MISRVGGPSIVEVKDPHASRLADSLCAQSSALIEITSLAAASGFVGSRAEHAAFGAQPCLREGREMIRVVAAVVCVFLGSVPAFAGSVVHSPCPQQLSCHAWVGGVSGQAEISFLNRTGNYLEVLSDVMLPNALPFYDLKAARMRATLNSITCPLDGSIDVTLDIVPLPEYGEPFQYNGVVRPYGPSLEMKRGRLNVHCGTILNITKWESQVKWRPKAE